MCASWIRAVFDEGTDMFMSQRLFMANPPSPVKDIVCILLALATDRAINTLELLPDVLNPTKTSPSLPIASVNLE